MYFFICSKDQLNVFENENPGLEPIIKNLLRSYAGIYDQPVPVYEKAIASSLKLSPEELIKGLLQLHKYQIILYNPQKETPRIYFNMSRRKAADIRIDEEAYLFRKGQFVKRISGMLEYVGTNACRSQDIARYFGEKDAGICGVCDNCVKKAKLKLTASVFQDISGKLIEQTAIAPIDVKFLFDRFSDIASDDLRKVIDFMQAENKLVVDDDGFVVFLK